MYGLCMNIYSVICTFIAIYVGLWLNVIDLVSYGVLIWSLCQLWFNDDIRVCAIVIIHLLNSTVVEEVSGFDNFVTCYRGRVGVVLAYSIELHRLSWAYTACGVLDRISCAVRASLGTRIVFVGRLSETMVHILLSYMLSCIGLVARWGLAKFRLWDFLLLSYHRVRVILVGSSRVILVGSLSARLSLC